MRVVAGELGGRRLVTPPGGGVRPTSDRVREALFSILGDISGLAVLDLFAGSGAMGLEALSRGARRCVFVESDRAACRVIHDNLEKLRFTGALVLQKDVFQALREERGRTYDLVLVDPPYGSWPDLEPRLAEVLPAMLAPDGLLVVETSSRVEPGLPLELVTSRRYGSARITLFTR